MQLRGRYIGICVRPGDCSRPKSEAHAAADALMLNGRSAAFRALRPAPCRIFSAYRLHVAAEARRTPATEGTARCISLISYKASKLACSAVLGAGPAGAGAAAQAPGRRRDRASGSTTPAKARSKSPPAANRICGRVVWLKNPDPQVQKRQAHLRHPGSGRSAKAGRQRLGVGLDLQSRGRGALQRRPEAGERQHAARSPATSASSCSARRSPGSARPTNLERCAAGATGAT